MVEELQNFQEFEDRPIEVEALPTNLELAKLFTWPRGLNQGITFETTMEVDLPNGYKRSVALTNQHVKLVGVCIPTKMDTSTRKVYMMRSNHIMNESDKTT